MTSTGTRHALTIDVEEWFHDDWRPNRGVDWDELPSTVVTEVERVLELLAAANVRATFFVLGDVVRRHPTLVRRIAAAGHEIGSHGYAHVKVASQTPDEFADDVRRSRALLEDALGAAIAGYRAPYFINSPRQLWATDVLASLGFRYDAGYVPVRWMPYAGRRAPRAPYRHPSGLWEFPLPFAEAYGGWNLPYAGGGPRRPSPCSGRPAARSTTFPSCLQSPPASNPSPAFPPPAPAIPKPLHTPRFAE